MTLWYDTVTALPVHVVGKHMSLQELKWSLQALAQPAEIQLQLYPDGCAKADELALDFNHWLTVAMDNRELTPEQSQRSNALDQRLRAMSGPEHGNLWTPEALHSDPAWASVRELASTALAAFDSKVVRPPPR